MRAWIGGRVSQTAPARLFDCCCQLFCAARREFPQLYQLPRPTQQAARILHGFHHVLNCTEYRANFVAYLHESLTHLANEIGYRTGN